MSDWDAAHYLKFADERTRPSVDLVTRIRLESPAHIVDLGCGPGNSTQVLCQRWRQARVLGVDNSPEMIQAAQHKYPTQSWLLDDVATWQPAETFDVVYSNAALQWLPNHQPLLRRLFSFVSPGGALAFQIPSGTYATVRTLIHEISRDPAWTARMEPARTSLTMESPAFYYDALADLATEIDLWETEYHHVLASQAAIVDWISSTGLRPFLAALHSEDERSAFLKQLHERVAAAYDTRIDGKVLFPFRRTFLIANR